MSTKIYNGYRLAEGIDPWAFCRDLRALMNPLRDAADASLLARLAASRIDHQLFNMPLSDTDNGDIRMGPLADAWSAFQKRQDSLDEYLHEKDPHRFEVTLGQDPETGRFMLGLYCEEGTMSAAFEAMPAVEEYGYWNNTDQPEGVTAAEWDERRAAWDRMLPGYTAPIENMLSFVLRSHAGPALDIVWIVEGDNRTLVLDRIPTTADRAVGVLRTALLSRMVLTDPETRNHDIFTQVRKADKLATANFEPLLPHMQLIDEAILRKYLPEPGKAAAAQAALAELTDRVAADLTTIETL